MQKILNTDLSATPEYERQRDVFIFHCCIGCRVGDLLRLKKSDVIDGAIEYIATKTIADNARTVRVPLNGTALAIIDKYKDCHETKLLPFISSQKYNDYIKVVLTKCGITRLVTVLNPNTRREEKQPHGPSHLHCKHLQQSPRPKRHRLNDRSRRRQPCLCPISHYRRGC